MKTLFRRKTKNPSLDRTVCCKIYVQTHYIHLIPINSILFYLIIPIGMGLGADKVIKKVKLLVTPAKNEKLEITKNAYVRILAGKRKDLYGQIEDYHASRVTVRLAVGGARETLNEFMVQPVSKQEFQEYGKVISKLFRVISFTSKLTLLYLFC